MHDYNLHMYDYNYGNIWLQEELLEGAVGQWNTNSNQHVSWSILNLVNPNQCLTYVGI